MVFESPEVSRHLLAGLKALRQGKVSAALQAWDAALAMDASCQEAAAFRDYVKTNRIRIAVHLGRLLPADHVPLDLPKSWPTPPAGFCDPLPPDTDKPAPMAPSQAFAENPTTSEAVALGTEEPEPYHILEIEGDRGGEEDEDGATTDFRAAPSSEYAVLEIIMDDEEDPIELSGELPPPPESVDAPEMVLEAPRVERLPAEAPADYLVVRADSENLDSLGLEHLAGPMTSDSTADPGASDAAPANRPSLPPFAEDAPTIARDPEGSPPRAFPTMEPLPEPPAPPGALSTATPDRAAALLQANQHRGATPHGTLMGVGLASLGDLGSLTPRFENGPPTASTGASPGSAYSPPPSADVAGARPAPPSPRQQPSSTPVPRPANPGDYSAAEGSFSDDLPTRMRGTEDSGPKGKALIRPMPGNQADDYVRAEGSFSDDLPTQTRPEPSDPPLEASPSHLPNDYVSTEGSFSDDLPTRTRDRFLASQRPSVPPPAPTEELTSMRRASDGIKPLPQPAGDAADPAVTSPQAGQAAGLSSSPQALLSRCRRLFQEGAYAECLELLDHLQDMHGSLPDLDALFDQAQMAYEDLLLSDLGPMDAMVIPQAASAKLSDLALDPRAAFLFTRIDGTLTLEDLLDISGMSRFETLQILVKLRNIGLLSVEPGR